MDQLLAMGFPEETAKAALEAHGNDLARSLDALLSTPEPASTQSSSPAEVSRPSRISIRLYVRSIRGNEPQHLSDAGVKYSLRVGLIDADRVQAMSGLNSDCSYACGI